MKGDRAVREKDAESKKRWRRRFINLGIVVISLSAFTAVWWLISWWLNISYLPSPPVVFEALIESFYIPDPHLGITMGQNIIASSERFIGGFALALVIAVPLGLLMGFMPTINTLAKPIIELLRPIPPIAWVPFLFVASAFWSPYLTVFIGAFFPIVTNVILGVKSVEPAMLDAARTQGAKKSDLFSKVILPFSVPYLMTGVTIGLGVGWMCIVAAEWYGQAGGGVGYYIIVSGQTSFYANMFAGMIVIALLGLATVGLSGYLESLIKKRMGMK
jgi:ABC-type nitrate/sulfonate/bicarbonate transport system permease component